ncbi:secreted VCBS domain protein [Catenovulum agarivorans DS-2]|uniref:Secreted VCBS domain protein n=1 Tax=Catenovulum agarivorans DS-2 TaxID=1328313 RepID=W7QA26_9ALTE|nr:VCBS domain-containing protein [Catenovulum agarivorans]EWH08851.1 secreted VCBS domain protein [Catenovulum agarivorans DS-2]
MKKQILAMSVAAALTGCDLDNMDDLQVSATFANNFTTEVGFYGTEGYGFDVELTTGHGQAEGELGVFDVNFGEAEPNYDMIPEAMYGTFTLEYVESGLAKWTYDLDETHPEVAAILDVANASITDKLTITTLDGTTQDLNFIIKGVDPSLPAEIKGALTANASIRETSAFGAVTVYDPNFGESKFQIGPVDDDGNPIGILSDNGYGSLFIDENGTWEFKVNRIAKNPEDETQTLKDMLPEADSPPVTDTVTLTTLDGTTQTIDVNIYGAVPNFAPELLSTTTEESWFDINMDLAGLEPHKTRNGKIVFKAKITQDLSRQASFSIGCSSNFHNDEKRRVATFYIQPDGQFEMWSGELKAGKTYDDRGIPGIFITPPKYKKVIFDQRFVPGEWSEFIITWEGASLTQKPLLKATLDGESLTSVHPAIPTDPDQGFVGSTLGGKLPVQCVNQMRFYVNADEDEGGYGAMMVDDIQYYTDIDADPIFEADTKALLNEKFANSQAGDVVQEMTVEGANVYEGSTENVLIARD